VRLEGAVLVHLASEVVRTPSGGSALRLAHIHSVLSARIAAWSPDRVAVESVFTARNARSALLLGQARGVALAVCGLAGLACDEYAPTQVKQAVCGSGAASKAQVQAMVQRLLGLETTPPADAADALAVAICHGHTSGSRGAARVAAARRAQA
jgi:crossover junction endodeoxyribonuclease RuvC